jgi:hypothetical protein
MNVKILKQCLLPAKLTLIASLLPVSSFAQSQQDPFNIDVIRDAQPTITCLDSTGFSSVTKVSEVSLEIDLNSDGYGWILGELYTEWKGKTDFMTRFGTVNADYAEKAASLLAQYGLNTGEERIYLSNPPYRLDYIVKFSPNLLESGTGYIEMYDQIFDVKREFRCFNNRSTNYIGGTWAQEELLLLEPANWAESALTKIQSVENTQIFSAMITAAKLEDFFSDLTQADAILVPSDNAIKAALSAEELTALFKPSQIAALQAVVKSQVIPGGWSIGDHYTDEPRVFIDANGKAIKIGIKEYVPGSGQVVAGGFYSIANGSNNGMPIDDNKDCDFDYNPFQTKTGIIYPSLCLRNPRIAD